ncbi:MAG: TIM barrel protein [Alphaproteobacteria bacterium]|nr:TIM barrel protein [Alphaproteobacteria bacterium]
MSLWLSSGAFRTDDVSELFSLAHTHGIYNIELSSGMDYHPDVMRLLDEEIERGVLNLIVHNYFPAPNTPIVLNIASLDPAGLEETHRFGSEAIKLAHKLGAPFYSIHAGFAANLRPEHLGKPGHLADILTADDIDVVKAYRVMIDTTRCLAEQAAELGLDLLVENNVVSPIFLEKMPVNPLLLTEAQEILQFFGDVDRPNVGLLLDVAHARVSARALNWSVHQFVDLVGEHVGCLHLSDNDGRQDNNRPITSDSWFLPRLKDFRDCEIVIEVYNLEPYEMHQQIALVQGHMG